MEEKKYNKDFEFTLLLNDNIIVKRNFDIIGFNQRAINSNNFRESVDYVVGVIKEDLRKKSIMYMLENIDNFYDNPKFDTNDSPDTIAFKVVYRNQRRLNVDGLPEEKVLANRVWDATVYPARIRYTVNIRDFIFEIITKIQKTLSTKSVNTNYLGYSLA